MDSKEVSLDTEKLEAKLSRSDFAQVIFQNVAEAYPPSAHVECHYTLTSAIQPTSKDWIGLYKVGWTSTRDYHTFNYAPPVLANEEEKDIEASVLFSSYYLPKEDGEFYQFVYVNKNGEVKGASTPFQFKSPTADDFIEIEDENTDMLLIKTKTAFCEERLTQATEEKARLLRQLKKCETEKGDLRQNIQTLESEIAEQKKNYDQLEGWYKKALSNGGAMENEKCLLESEIAEQKKNYDQLEGWYKKALSNGGAMEKEKCSLELKVKKCEEDIQTSIAEKESLEKELAEVTDEAEGYKSEIEDLRKTIEELEEEIENCNKEVETYKEHFQAAEEENKKLKEEIVVVREQLSQTDSSLERNKEEVQHLQSRIDDEKKKFERQLSVSEADKTHMSALEEKLKNSEDKMRAFEDTKKLLTEELDTLKQVQENMSRTLEVKTTEIDNQKIKYQRLQKTSQDKQMELHEEIRALRDGLTQLDKEKSNLVKQIHRMENEHEGPLFALQQVNKHLKEKHDKLLKKYEELLKQRDDLVKKHVTTEQERSDLQREVEDLRERLEMGAVAWTEKYKECKKLATKVKKLKKSSSFTTDQQTTFADGDVTEEVVLTKSSDEGKEESSQSVDSDQPLAFDSVLHTQLNDLEKELQEREQKYKTYKKRYQEEKVKVGDLEKKHKEDIAGMTKKLDEEKEINQKLNREIEELRSQLGHYQFVEEEVNLLREELVREKSEQQKKDEEYMVLLRQIESSDLSLRPTIENQRDTVDDDIDETSNQVFPNPYEDEARVLRQQRLNGRDGPTLIPRGAQAIPLPGLPIRQQPFGHQMFPMRQPPPPPFRLQRPPPLGGAHLPPPLQPEVLPTAREAAVRSAINIEAKTPPPPPPADEQDVLQEVLDEASMMSDPKPAADDVCIDVDTENHEAHSASSVDETAAEERDDGPQEFHDAPEFPEETSMKWCPICHLLFPPSCPQDTFDQHVQSHSGRICPMCGVKFPKDPETQQSFERHVQEHFEQDG